MTRGRNLITTILLAATILFISIRNCEARDDTPPPRMLLNLDLFTSQPEDRDPLPAGGDDASVIEQLRELRAMGYFSDDGPLPDVDDDSDNSHGPQDQTVDEPPDQPVRRGGRDQGAQQ